MCVSGDAASSARSDAPAAPARSAARANGAGSNTRPRFVFDGVQRAVASTAARIVVPSGRSPARASAGPIAAALARKSSKVASRNDADGDTLPGLGARSEERRVGKECRWRWGGAAEKKGE